MRCESTEGKEYMHVTRCVWKRTVGWPHTRWAAWKPWRHCGPCGSTWGCCWWRPTRERAHLRSCSPAKRWRSNMQTGEGSYRTPHVTSRQSWSSASLKAVTECRGARLTRRCVAQGSVARCTGRKQRCSCSRRLQRHATSHAVCTPAQTLSSSCGDSRGFVCHCTVGPLCSAEASYSAGRCRGQRVTDGGACSQCC